VKLIEETVKSENFRLPNRPIYLVGESIGACLALDVAARNPNIDLSLILVNPGTEVRLILSVNVTNVSHHRHCFVAATHVNNFMVQPLSGMLNVLPDGLPTLLEDIFDFGFKQGTLLFSSHILS